MIEVDNSLLCTKCKIVWPDADDAFYWDKRRDTYRKPCKQCIGDYNRRPDQHARRIAAMKRWRKTPRGKEVMKKYWKKRAARNKEERKQLKEEGWY